MNKRSILEKEIDRLIVERKKLLRELNGNYPARSSFIVRINIIEDKINRLIDALNKLPL